MLLIEADVPAQGSLRPGLFARADIVINQREPVLTVPAEAIITFAGLEKVIVVQNGKALEKAVSTGRRQHEAVEVLSGVKADEVVVLSPGALRTGQPVTIATEPQLTAPESAPKAVGQ